MNGQDPQDTPAGRRILLPKSASFLAVRSFATLATWQARRRTATDATNRRRICASVGGSAKWTFWCCWTLDHCGLTAPDRETGKWVVGMAGDLNHQRWLVLFRIYMFLSSGSREHVHGQTVFYMSRRHWMRKTPVYVSISFSTLNHGMYVLGFSFLLFGTLSTFRVHARRWVLMHVHAGTFSFRQFRYKQLPQLICLGISSTIVCTCATRGKTKRFLNRLQEYISHQPQNLWNRKLSSHHRKNHGGKASRVPENPKSLRSRRLGFNGSKEWAWPHLAFQGTGCISGRNTATGRQQTISCRLIGPCLIQDHAGWFQETTSVWLLNCITYGRFVSFLVANWWVCTYWHTNS